MTTSKRAAPTNRLLAMMPIAARTRFIENCEPVELTFAEVLCDAGERIRHVYFPLDSFISLVTTLDDGAKLEVGIVGEEGMLGTSLALGVDISPQHALVQGAGSALRMTAVNFNRQRERNPRLQTGLNRYLYVLISQLAQNAACIRYHVVEARLARWLLMTRDRARSEEFRLTHEFLAYMLGVRRVGVTEAALALQQQGLITYSRGTITILDDARLEKASCACYRQGNAMYQQTMQPGRRVRREH